MADDHLLVDGELFLARREEQNLFRQALREALSRDTASQNAPVFLAIGGVGMGKYRDLPHPGQPRPTPRIRPERANRAEESVFTETAGSSHPRTGSVVLLAPPTETHRRP